MTNEQLCALALAAIDSSDARVVLADAIEESGWWDERLGEPRRWSSNTGSSPWYQFFSYLGSPVCLRAIAAVLLFGGWCDPRNLADWSERRWFPYTDHF